MEAALSVLISGGVLVLLLGSILLFIIWPNFRALGQQVLDSGQGELEVELNRKGLHLRIRSDTTAKRELVGRDQQIETRPKG